MNWEFVALDFIQNSLRSSLGDILFPFVSRLGDVGAIWFAVSLILLCRRRTHKIGLAMFLALGIGALCCNVLLKNLTARLRPCDIKITITLLIPRPGDFSFPSGHTTAAFAATSSLYFSRHHQWKAAALLAAAIAFSRLYLYIHFPTDILAGSLLGIISGWLGNGLTAHLLKVLETAEEGNQHNAHF